MALRVADGVDLRRRKPARKPGQRADLTIRGIVEAGFAVLEEYGLQGFSARLVGLLRAPPIGARGRISPARRLDVAMTVILGMILVEAESRREGISNNLSNALTRRVRSYPPDAVPKLLANSTELSLQIKRRLIPMEPHLRRTATRYAAALLAALETEGAEARPGSLNSV
jgi:hypothetical protein